MYEPQYCIIFAPDDIRFKKNIMNRIPTVTKNLLAINVLMFLALFAMARYGVDLGNILGLHLFMSEDFQPYQLVTYMFMHGGLVSGLKGSVTHIFFNMFALYMFGGVLERAWGAKRFLVYYLVAGIGAALVQEAVGVVRYNMALEGMTPQDVELVMSYGLNALHEGKNFVNPQLAQLNLVLNSTTVGASGAIYAILLGFGMLFPEERMFVFPIPFPIKAKYFVMGYAVIELYLGVSGSADGIAHFAHLGGMLFGLLLILYWQKKGKISGPYVR